MSRTRLTDDELLERLLGVFRAHGYAGTSLADVSEVTGMGRASLYHRFPGGKDDMATAVLRHAHARFGAEVLAPSAREEDPRRAARRMARGLDAFYSGGQACCILDTMTLGSAPSLQDDAAGSATEELRALAAESLGAWVGRCAEIARSAGHPRAVARRRAEDAIARIEGGLVLARVHGDRKAFRRALDDLPEALTTSR